MYPETEIIESPTWPIHTNPYDASQGTLVERHGPFSIQLEEKAPAWVRVRSLMQDAFSEFFGVFIFLLFSLASIAQVTLSNGTKGTYTSVVLGWGYIYLRALMTRIEADRRKIE